MNDCAFKNCIHNGERNEDPLQDVTFHLFPKDPILREKWLKQMNQENWSPSYSSALCSLHFNKDYFVTDARGLTYLKPEAIPTEFEMNQEYTEMDETTPVSCCAYRCTNVLSPDSTITFHPFPLDMPELCSQWLAAMNCSQLEGDEAVLCSEHFDDTCFVYNEEGQKFLISEAVPSIFLYPDANDVNDEATGEDGIGDGEDMMDMQTENGTNMSIVKYEISDDNLELIGRHDEVVTNLMDETQRLLELNAKRVKLEKRKKELQLLLRSTIYNLPIEKRLLRGMKPLLQDLNELHQNILVSIKSPCVSATSENQLS